jgi:hypothetical protein
VATRYLAPATAMLWFSGVLLALLALLAAIGLVDRAHRT